MISRGHANIFARLKSPYDKDSLRIIEKYAVIEWGRAVTEKYGHSVTNVLNNLDDPPDCFATINGEDTAIEVTELVDEAMLSTTSRIAKGKREQLTGPENFSLRQWTSDKFRRKIEALIDQKASKFRNRPDLTCDILLIITAEPWLSPDLIQNWLRERSFDRRPELGDIFLLKDYVPNHTGIWPIFNLCDGQ